MRIALIGSRWFGAQMFRLLGEKGHDLSVIGLEEEDQLTTAARAGPPPRLVGGAPPPPEPAVSGVRGRAAPERLRSRAHSHRATCEHKARSPNSRHVAGVGGV